MADPDPDTKPGEPARIAAFGLIASLHPVTEIVQHLGDAAHPDAADADKMYRPDRVRQRSHAARSSPANPDCTSPNTSAASRSAASLGVKRRAHVAASRSPAGSPRS